MKLSGALPIYHTKEKEQILYIIRIFTFNDKNPLYLPIILTLHFFDGQSDQGVIHLVIKPVDISQTFRIVGLS